MSSSQPIFETALPGLKPHRHGKVRDLYETGEYLLIVATDRISAFDLVLGSVIPEKGKVLTHLSAFWFERTRSLVQNHMLSTRPEEYPGSLSDHASLLRGRSMLVRRTKPLPIECVARGYLSGSGWKEYRETGQVCGITLPQGLRESDQLKTPIFTPATKAQTGHDTNINEEEAGKLIGHTLLKRLRELTLALYSHGAAYAESRGIILADTKFEFGLIETGTKPEIVLIDEALTPDSSRFWPKSLYRPGTPQPSFDKQYVRDYLDDIRWNRQPPAPGLPDEVITRTRDKYLEAFRQLTGKELEEVISS